MRPRRRRPDQRRPLSLRRDSRRPRLSRIRWARCARFRHRSWPPLRAAHQIERRRRQRKSAERKGHLRERSDAAALREQHEIFDLLRSHDRQNSLGEKLRGRLRSHVDFAGRKNNLSAVVRAGALARHRCAHGRRARENRPELRRAQHHRRPERARGVSRWPEISAAHRGRHDVAHRRAHRRAVQQFYPAVHRQRPADFGLRERERITRF